MLKDTDYVLANSHETFIGKLPLGVRVLVAIGRDLTEEEKSAITRHSEAIYNELWKGHTLQDQERIANAAKEKEEILKLFEGKNIFVEEIPNGYCNQPCCVNLPWFIVTTPIGCIKIGWRKRVIAIDWARTIQRKTANELFPNEDVTKGAQDIHAWGYEKAKEYLDVIHVEKP